MITALCLLLASPQVPQVRELPAPAEIFAKVDRLDPLDTRTLPVVQVLTGTFARANGSPPQAVGRYGFLLGSKGRDFHVRFLDLDRRQLSTSAAGTPAHLRVGFMPVELKEVVHQTLAELASGRSTLRRGPGLSNDGRLVLLARACARRGMDAEVRRIWEALARRSQTPLEQDLATDLSDLLALAFEDQNLSWATLLERHEHWLRDWGKDHFLAGLIQARSRWLAWLIREEKRRAAAAPRPGDLGLELCAQRNPARHPGAAKGPQQRILAMGLQAVPDLIASLHLQAPTRHIAFESCHNGHFEVQSVRGLALETLSKLAGYSLHHRGEAAAWHRSARRLGIARTLEAAVKRPGFDGLEAATSLLARWPERVPVVIQRIAHTAPGSSARQSFLDLIGQTDHRDALDYLRGLLREDLPVDELVLVAQHLHRRGAKEGQDAVLRRWAQSLGAAAARPPEVDEPPRRDAATELREPLLGILLHSGTLEAWTALGKGIDRSTLRTSLLRELRRTPPREVLAACDAARLPQIEAVLESILTSALEDPSAYQGAYLEGWHLGLIHGARVADYAAVALAQLWPERYRFDPSAVRSERHQQHVYLANTWRKAQGKPALPIPPRIHGRPVDAVAVPAAQLAHTITGVHLHPSLADVPPQLLAGLHQLKGKAMDARRLMQLAIQHADQDQLESQALVLRLERARVCTGLRLFVALRTKDAAAEEGSQVYWRAVCGGRLLDLGSQHETDRKLEAAGLRRQIAQLQQALATPPGTPVEIELEVQMR